ncbi:hypothetical protein OEZ86_009033 [Tetradesmus obliquus]|uniref:DNA replication complex GINS protein SLD5 n=1 Tax=Tetradesmus obliquus TaxID=3088 RepID=A0A383W996_TETOB|nr:hypothetical protein OEZ86_009033 [Tetradesmus obliquus]|eukprot:jgi/Sobl393_1/5282/SZX73803.1
MDPNDSSQRDQSGQPSTSGMHHEYATQDGSLDMGCSDFELLKRALLNERMAPEILQYKEELVERVKAGLKRQETEIDAMEGQRDYELVRQVLSYEQDRVRFLLKAYLRARLEKIEQSAGSMLDTEALRERLSKQERSYASSFFVAMGRYMKSSVLNDLPPNYQSLVKRYEGEAEKRLLDTPDEAKYVFARVLDDCGQVPDGPDGQTAELRRGDTMAIKYTTVKALVEAGQVCLL